jgi:hypothetical protein
VSDGEGADDPDCGACVVVVDVVVGGGAVVVRLEVVVGAGVVVVALVEDGATVGLPGS